MRGFSLVELSIVLVILGLLTGGVLTGQSLIRAAELRSITVSYERYVTAALSFRTRYMELPGDLSNATRFWTAEASCPGDYTSPSSGSATCNGNGDGRISSIVPALEDFSERYRFWQHLANAGLIEGTYTGVPAASVTVVIAGQNIPSLRLGGGGMGIVYADTLASSISYQDGIGQHLFYLLNASGPSTISTSAPLLTTEEAWNIDSKMDDGKPSYGKVRSRPPTSVSTPNCSSNTDPALAQYQLTVSGKQCLLSFDAGF